MNVWMNELSPAQRSSEEILRNWQQGVGIAETGAWERRRHTASNSTNHKFSKII